MKRINNLYSKIISIENLYLADARARYGKQNTYGVKIHDKNKDENLLKLHLSLLNKTYKTSNYSIFTIYEPKEREIYRLPYYPDRIVHHAIMNILEPIWLSIFTHNTYSCIKNRGISKCASDVTKIIKKYNNKQLYCLKIDIKKFYPSIDHDILKYIIRKKIKDKDLLWLLDEIIDSAPGLPIGNYLSLYLANLYLAYFMHWVNELLHIIVGKKEKIYVTEYADDIVFFLDDKACLHKILQLVKLYLTTNLKLTIKSNYLIFPIAKNVNDKHGRALDYVGYKFYMNQKLLRKSIKLNLCRKVYKIYKSNKYITYKDFKISISPWIGWCKYSNSKHLLKIIIDNNQYYYMLLNDIKRIKKKKRKNKMYDIDNYFDLQ